MTPPSADLERERIRAVYAGREAFAGRYAWHRGDVLLSAATWRWTLAAELRRLGWTDLGGREVLDLGCGQGGFLRCLVDWGADSSRLHGIDLIAERVDRARASLPAAVDLRLADARDPPYADDAFDLVAAHTLFSSLIDDAIRSAVAAAMARVLRPGGLCLIYDFRYRNPRNPDVRPLGHRQVTALFPGWPQRRHTLTLAPPLARRLAPLVPGLCVLAERLLPPLRSHVLYLLTKPGVLP